MPRHARLNVGESSATQKPPFFFFNDTATTEIYTLPLHDALPISIARATESWVDETTVVEVTVTPAPKEALAPAWKFVPVTLTVRLAPSAPAHVDTLAIIRTRKVTAASAEEPSAKLAVRVKLAPLLNCVGLKSETK